MFDSVTNENTRVFKDVQSVGAELKSMNERGDVYGTEVKPQVAIVYDVENRWALDAAAGPRNKDKDEKYVETLLTHYRPFWDKGVQVDIVDMDGDISKYKLVIAPMLYMYRAGFEKKMRKFVENGGHACHNVLERHCGRYRPVQNGRPPRRHDGRVRRVERRN